MSAATQIRGDACNAEVYERGSPVLLTHSIKPEDMDKFAALIAEDSGQLVDWHFVAGRAVFKAVGDLVMVRASMFRNLNTLMDAQRQHFESFGFEHREWTPQFQFVKPDGDPLR